MFKKFMFLALSGILMLNLSGCFLFVAGVAGGGTAVWLSGKLTQEFDTTYEHTIDATRAALQSLNLQVTKETQTDNVTQFQGSYSNGKDMWVDIHRIARHSTKVEVRVGGLTPDKDAAAVVLRTIGQHL